MSRWRVCGGRSQRVTTGYVVKYGDKYVDASTSHGMVEPTLRPWFIFRSRAEAKSRMEMWNEARQTKATRLVRLYRWTRDWVE